MICVRSRQHAKSGTQGTLCLQAGSTQTCAFPDIVSHVNKLSLEVRPAAHTHDAGQCQAGSEATDLVAVLWGRHSLTMADAVPYGIGRDLLRS